MNAQEHAAEIVRDYFKTGAPVLEAAIAAALAPSAALVAVLAEYERLVNGIHGEYCGGDTWQECDDERRCAKSRAILATLRKELGL